MRDKLLSGQAAASLCYLPVYGSATDPSSFLSGVAAQFAFEIGIAISRLHVSPAAPSWASASIVHHLGIPAANHELVPAMDRIRSTGLVQGFGGAGESVSSMRKSPFTSSGTPARFELCWIFPSFAQNSVAKTLALALLPTPLPEPRRRPRPSSRMLPSCFTSAARSLITQIWPAAATPRTVVFAEPVGITPIPPLNLTKFWARAG